MQLKIINKKPEKLWEWREYKKGCLIENGIALNETATFIWKLCDGKRTIKEIINKVVEIYEVKKEIVERDVLNLIKLLLEEKTIKLK